MPNGAKYTHVSMEKASRSGSSQSRWYEKFTSMIDDTWTLEILSLLASSSLLVALCVFLQVQNGKPPPSYSSALGATPSLNAIVSIISTAMKAFLVFPVGQCIGQLKWRWMLKQRPLADLETFDAASRGFSGSLALLWNLKWHTAASLGAVLMILSISLDAFSQQLVLIASDSVLLDGTHGQILRVTDWVDPTRYSDGVITPGSVLDGGNTIGLPTGMKGAIQLGLNSANLTVNSTVPFCPTGNCKFDPFLSLGVCSSVANVSDHLMVRNITTPDTAPGSFTPQYYLGPNASMTSFLGSSLIFMNVSSALTLYETDKQQAAFNNVDSIAFPQVGTPIADVFILEMTLTEGRKLDPSVTMLDHRYFAYEFVLEWCVQNYSVSVANGSVNTQVLNSIKNFTGGQDSTFVQGGPGMGYSIDPGAQRSLQLHFHDLFEGNVSQPNIDSTEEWFISSDVVQSLFEPFRYKQALKDLSSSNGTLSNGIQGTGLVGLQNIIDNIATSMTNFLRQSGQSVSGDAYHDINQVHVRFQWATPLVIFITLAWILLGITIFESRRANATMPHHWKNSSLALLHAVDPDLQAELGGLESLSQLRARNRDSVAVLRSASVDERNSETSWRLMGTKNPT